MPRSRFLGDTGVPLPEFQGDIYKFWGTDQNFQIFTAKLNSYPEISVHTGPRSAVGNVSGNRCESDCRSRGREFDPGPVPYFRGD